MKTKEELLKEKQEIESQIQMLEDIEEQKEIERVRKNNELFIEAIRDSEWIKQYAHGRTSCGDNHVVNGFCSAEGDNFRCTKCALLEMTDGIGIEDWEIKIEIVRR